VECYKEEYYEDLETMKIFELIREDILHKTKINFAEYQQLCINDVENMKNELLTSDFQDVINESSDKKENQQIIKTANEIKTDMEKYMKQTTEESISFASSYSQLIQKLVNALDNILNTKYWFIGNRDKVVEAELKLFSNYNKELFEDFSIKMVNSALRFKSTFENFFTNKSSFKGEEKLKKSSKTAVIELAMETAAYNQFRISAAHIQLRSVFVEGLSQTLIVAGFTASVTKIMTIKHQVEILSKKYKKDATEFGDICAAKLRKAMLEYDRDVEEILESTSEKKELESKIRCLKMNLQ